MSDGRSSFSGMVIAVTSLAFLSSACTIGTATGPATQAPLPAGRNPSKIASMICRYKAIQDIDSALGETATVSNPTWVDHLYSCQYGYSAGSMVLSVKELSSWTETDAYFQMLADQMGKTRSIPNLGQGTFQTSNGSLVVRKDWKVLLVDVAGLPSQFGTPPASAAEAAVTVGDVILGCWEGD